jgi:hypothetical protein
MLHDTYTQMNAAIERVCAPCLESCVFPLLYTHTEGGSAVCVCVCVCVLSQSLCLVAFTLLDDVEGLGSEMKAK